MKIGVLALQGAFAEHEKVLEQLGAECIELRQARDLSEPYDADRKSTRLNSSHP